MTHGARTPHREAARCRLCGPAAIEAALARGEPVRVLLVERTSAPALHALLERVERAGGEIWYGGFGDLRRMSPDSTPQQAIALVGPPPRATLDELLARGGASWLLHGAAYPSNVGFAIRTAEVSGAAGVVVDGIFNHDARSRVSHVSMGADRLLPVLWARSSEVVTCARRRGTRVIALEGGGTRAPWQVDLRGDVLLIAGNERDGIEPALLAQCDAVVTIPMLGFVPSYNVQAAISAVASERIRQLYS